MSFWKCPSCLASKTTFIVASLPPAMVLWSVDAIVHPHEVFISDISRCRDDLFFMTNSVVTGLRKSTCPQSYRGVFVTSFCACNVVIRHSSVMIVEMRCLDIDVFPLILV